MDQPANQLRPVDEPSSRNAAGIAAAEDRVEQLVSSLVDQVATNEELLELESLMQTHAECRSAYLGAMHLDSMLRDFFQGDSAPVEGVVKPPANIDLGFCLPVDNPVQPS